MSNRTPEFSDLSKIEEGLLAAKLQAIRKALSHAGEKGRALEGEVRNFLRGILPSAYGLTTGFVAYHTPDGPRLSSQLDIIIYDSVRSGPIVRLEPCDVLPLEAVYAYIEVKASIQSTSDSATRPASNSLESCLETNRTLRNMMDRRFWVQEPGSMVKSRLVPHEWMGIRSYIFAFEPFGEIASSPERFARRIASVSRRLGPPTHVHGLFIANHSFFFTRPVDIRTAKAEDYYHVNYTSDHPLLAFKSHLLRALTTFPRFQDEWAPAIDQYYTDDFSWGTCAPDR